MNSWKRSLFGAGVGVEAGSGPGDVGPCAGHLRAGLPRQAGGLVGSGKWSGEWSREWSGERR